MDSTSLQNSLRSGADAALDELLARARTLEEDRLAPRRPLGPCLRALGQVLTFIHSQPVLRAEPSLRPDMGRAVLRIAQELESPTQTPLAIPLPLSVEHEEAIRTGVMLLAAYRAAVERCGARILTPRISAEFGIASELKSRDGAAVADGIGRFLAAAVRYPEALLAAGLSVRQLAGLEAQERVLRAQLVQRQRQAVTPGLPGRVQLLHLALDSFFDRFEAGLGARLWSEPATRIAGMRLVPKAGLAPVSARRPVAGVGLPAYQPTYQPTYLACQMTDSGRLIFS